ncbi:MAG: S8 family serine peptidase [Calothrix sp. CSU_2_0]|nr:S8 family serine peptidase [Calothrix sp. CSU_2_0]
MTFESNPGMVNLPKSNSPISPTLWGLYNEYNPGNLRTEPSPGLFRSSSNFMQMGEDGSSVLVRVTGHDINSLTPKLEDMGFKTVAASPEHHLVEGFLSIAAIPYTESLTSQGLMGVMALPKPYRNVGLVTSQDDIVSETQRVRDALPQGFDGTGVRIGVMSDSFDVSGFGSAAEDIASGDLPAEGVKILQELPPEFGPGIDEGRAMSQLIYDLAPGASQVFSSVFISEVDFAQQIRNLADPNKGNADILVDDIIYFAEPFFQDGIVAQAVDDVVTNRGVSYFSSAGNFARQAYESANFAGTGDSAGIIAGRFHDFDPGAGVDTRQLITLSPGFSQFVFQWDDPFYTTNGVDTDLDIFLVNPGTGDIIESIEVEGFNGFTNNIVNQTPLEILVVQNSSSSSIQAELIIKNSAGADPGRIKYVYFGPAVIEEFDTKSPATWGHSAAVNASSVAAVNYFDQQNPASFTSAGPVAILFNPDGTRKDTPEVRQKPDFAAIQGTDTTFFGNDIGGQDVDGNGFPNFFGTSAAAPHAAAIAALIKQANPNFTPEQIYQRLESTATDIGAPGRDDLTGFGLINAYDAVFGSAKPAQLNFSDDFEDGDLPIFYETNTTVAGRIRVTTENNPIGTKHITLDNFVEKINDPEAPPSLNSLNELILRVDTSGKSNVVFNFAQKEFNDADNVMPEFFQGSANADGVALSVDGLNWYRLFDLTGTNSTNEYQNKSSNLSDFAASKGLTLGSDVRIKFQQFGDKPIPNSGFAFDNISVTGVTAGVNLNGTSNDDNLTGTAGNDTIRGFNGQDILKGLAGDDLLDGGDGDDKLFGGEGKDNLIGGSGQDQLYGEAGNDKLDGGDGDDKLFGGDGNDRILGGQGQDFLYGDAGNDILIGGSGDNTLTGGIGKDTFVLSTEGKNNITDFKVGEDLIGLTGGLNYASLRFVSQNGGTFITTNNNQPLAFLTNVDASLLKEKDFILV